MKTHTFTRQQIIKTICCLHCRKDPLNISAVKRYHPELIQAVYAIKPFWGWKNALSDARINYTKIKVELQKYVRCELCYKFMRGLSAHLIKKHEVRSDEYLMDYPDAELLCEDTRANMLRKDSSPIAHWEPCWSREYVLDRVAEYYRRGYPLHQQKFKDTDVTLIMAAKQYLGGWKEALIAIGLDPRKLTEEAFRQSRNYPDKEAVIRGIKQRLAKGLGVNFSALRNKHYGNRSRMSLVMSGVEYFGSWDNALKAAGIDPDAMRQALIPKRKYKTGQEIIREIRARSKCEWPLNSMGISFGKHQDVCLKIYGREYFGSWDNVLKAAGLDPVKIHRQVVLRHYRYPDSESLLKAMRQRNNEGRPMNYSGVAYGSGRDVPMLKRASTFFGSWNNALKRIGIDPAKIKHAARSCAALNYCRRKNMS